MKKEHITFTVWTTLVALTGVGLGAYFYSLPGEPVQASSSDRSDSVIIATGPVFTRITSASMTGNSATSLHLNYISHEAVYALDQNTGSLTAGVLLREGQGGFQGFFQTNLNQGLASVMATAGDNMPFPLRPRYTMVTGEVNIPHRAGSEWHIPQGVVYVHEQSTGYMMVYSIPWTNDFSSGRPQNGSLQLWTAYRFTTPYVQN
ncbi:MAG: hypothetical protein LBT05_00475 [Planctomycetaceae bacterium]|jgi:hypothetical protein|nr:hypothetical protein [Planctomycetaceae bacterium]